MHKLHHTLRVPTFSTCLSECAVLLMRALSKHLTANTCLYMSSARFTLAKKPWDGRLVPQVNARRHVSARINTTHTMHSQPRSAAMWGNARKKSNDSHIAAARAKRTEPATRLWYLADGGPQHVASHHLGLLLLAVLRGSHAAPQTENATETSGGGKKVGRKKGLVRSRLAAHGCV